MLGFPILYFKGMRLMMFQLSGFYYKPESCCQVLFPDDTVAARRNGRRCECQGKLLRRCTETRLLSIRFRVDGGIGVQVLRDLGVLCRGYS